MTAPPYPLISLPEVASWIREHASRLPEHKQLAITFIADEIERRFEEAKWHVVALRPDAQVEAAEAQRDRAMLVAAHALDARSQLFRAREAAARWKALAKHQYRTPSVTARLETLLKPLQRELALFRAQVGS